MEFFGQLRPSGVITAAMMMKIHLKTSDDPIASGTTVTANCGTEVPNAVARFWFDLSESDSAFLNSLKICRGCYSTRNNHGRYLSGIVSGQEAITEKIA